jgi:hypothetical protein
MIPPLLSPQMGLGSIPTIDRTFGKKGFRSRHPHHLKRGGVVADMLLCGTSHAETTLCHLPKHIRVRKSLELQFSDGRGEEHSFSSEADGILTSGSRKSSRIPEGVGPGLGVEFMWRPGIGERREYEMNCLEDNCLDLFRWVNGTT